MSASVVETPPPADLEPRKAFSVESRMRQIRMPIVIALALACVARPSASQTPETVSLLVKAALVDADLNLRPVPKHALLLKPASEEHVQPIRVVLAVDGTVHIRVLPGEYVLESERVVPFQGKTYRWQHRVTVRPNVENVVELGIDNAIIDDGAAGGSSSSSSRGLPELFREWQDSVVTVWSETGHGTGFLIDGDGLIATNQHVVGASEYVAVQLNPALKVQAQVLSANADKDVAVLWVNPSVTAALQPVELAFAQGGAAPVVEGEQVFTIGSPLNQRKVMTSGIVSRIEEKIIISDVNINHGNSGGPLFAADGRVIGITTFGDFTSAGGPGISGIVRIDEARDVIAMAKQAIAAASPPSSIALPVEPQNAFPLDALRATVEAREVKLKDYELSTKNFDLTFVTPVLLYGLQYQAEQETLKERRKRNRGPSSVRETMAPFESFRNWAAYVGELKPVLMIRATPKLVEGFWSAFGRGLAASQGYYGGPAKLRFKSDFYKMRVYCGASEVAPIHPSRIEHRVAVDNAAVRVNDATYEGLYIYGPNDIGPHCGDVRIELFTESDPKKPDHVRIKADSAEWLWRDFSSFRAATGQNRIP